MARTRRPPPPAVSRPPDIRDLALALQSKRPAKRSAAPSLSPLSVSLPAYDSLPPPPPLQPLPSERDYISAQLAPILDQIARQRAQQDAFYGTQQAAIQGATQALIDQLGGWGNQFKGDYGGIAKQQIASGEALQASQAAGVAPANAATQALLGAIGAPASQQAAVGEVAENVGEGAGAVLMGTGGTIPAEQTKAEGAAYGGYAAELPSIAGLYGQQAIGDVMRAAGASQVEIDLARAEAYAQMPALSLDYARLVADTKRRDYEDQYRYQSAEDQRKEAYQNRALNLYNNGLLTQRDAARALGIPGWQKYPAATRSSAAAPELRGGARDGFYVWDPNTGKLTQLTRPLPTETKPTKPTRLTIVGSDKSGRWAVDPYTGERIVQISPPVKPGAKPAKPTKPTYRKGADGRTYLIDPNTNSAIPVEGMPGKTQTQTKQRQKPPTTAMLRRGWETITESYPHLEGSSKRLASTDLQRIYNKYRKALNRNGIDSPQQLLSAPPAVKKLLGIAGANRDPQDVYMELVHSGIPARRAWTMVRKYYPEWGKDYFRPKGSAPASGASYSASSTLSNQQLQALWIEAGGDPKLANTMAAIALAESSGRVNAFNPNPPDYSVGLWQINYYGRLRGSRTRTFGSPEKLRRDPLANARAAVRLAAGGSGLSHWTTYTSGAYRRYLV